MKTITISITVPDGAEVRVNNSSGGDRPFVERAAPPTPYGDCPEHDVPWKLVPAGVSKKAVDNDGNPKRYNAFWACPERGCNEKPARVDELPF